MHIYTLSKYTYKILIQTQAHKDKEASKSSKASLQSLVNSVTIHAPNDMLHFSSHKLESLCQV